MIVKIEFDLNPVLNVGIEDSKAVNRVFEKDRDELSDTMLENLKRLMKAKGIHDYQELSQVSEIPYQTIISFCERGMANTQFSTILKLMSYFNCTLSDLILSEERQDKLIKADGFRQELVRTMMNLKLYLSELDRD